MKRQIILLFIMGCSATRIIDATENPSDDSKKEMRSSEKGDTTETVTKPTASVKKPKRAYPQPILAPIPIIGWPWATKSSNGSLK